VARAGSPSAGSGGGGVRRERLPLKSKKSDKRGGVDLCGLNARKGEVPPLSTKKRMRFRESI